MVGLVEGKRVRVRAKMVATSSRSPPALSGSEVNHDAGEQLEGGRMVEPEDADSGGRGDRLKITGAGPWVVGNAGRLGGPEFEIG